MPNQTHRAPPRYKISDFFSSLLEFLSLIRQVSPTTGIVFLSQYSDLDIVQAALDAGALSYVHKTYAKSDLLRTIEAVLRGERFIREA